MGKEPRNQVSLHQNERWLCEDCAICLTGYWGVGIFGGGLICLTGYWSENIWGWPDMSYRVLGGGGTCDPYRRHKMFP